MNTRHRIPKRSGLYLPLAVLALFSGCGLLDPDPLSVSLEVEPAEIAVGDTFRVHLTIRNSGPRHATLVSPHSCVALPAVYGDGEPVRWAGTAGGCLTVVTDHVIPPHGELRRVYELRAAPRAGLTSADPVVPGVYQVRANLEVTLDEPTPATLTVR